MKKLLFIQLFLWSAIGVLGQQIMQAEYFWDTDPGAGNGIAMNALDGGLNAALEAVFAETTALPDNGNHTFNMRVMDHDLSWSPVFSVMVYVEDELFNTRQISITQAEYFWNTDPGAGNGTPLLVADGNYDDALEQMLGSLTDMPEVGTHVLHVRARDAANVWSAPFSVVVNVEAEITTMREVKITAGEYFWNTDPGAGNGTPLLVADGDYNQALEHMLENLTDMPAIGTHVLHVRARDAANVWSMPFSVVVNVEAEITTMREVKVTAGEYFFNTDPGAGNGTPMLALDGNFNTAIEAIKGGAIPTPIAEGMHVLWMRAKDAENLWGPAFGVVVNMDTTITDFEAIISGATEFCQGESLLGISYSAQAATGSTYSWTATNGVITSGQGTPNVVVNWNPGGNRTLSLTQCIGANCADDQIVLTIHPTFDLEEEMTICSGESVLLGGQLQTESGVYTDTYQTIHGCDSIVHTNLIVVDEIVTTATAEICEGESIFLEGEMQTEPGDYTDTYQSQAGCDSLVVTTLSVYPSYYIDDVEAIVCEGDSVFLSGGYQTIPGAYTDILASVFGCDSIVVTTLIIDELPQPTVVIDGLLLSTLESYASYQWYFEGSPIDGATNVSYEAQENGDYTVEVINENGCVGMSNIYTVITVGVTELNAFEVRVFPNPTSGQVRIEFSHVGDSYRELVVFDMAGKVVFEKTLPRDQSAVIDLSSLARGTYTMRVATGTEVLEKRIVRM